ncbi:MAG: shikimate dehydrogenase [Rhizobiales bacterium]|nr:shikimate dehydrogenase [Hyphomicrobiales bacterium]
MAATSKFKAACVIGWPVEHSRSPLIHSYWITKYGLNAEYRREAVPPEQFEEFVRGLAARGYVGANVTIPNKEAARALSKADDRADKVGASNTLWLDGSTLRSTNTDVEGFINNLDASAAGWNRGLDTAVVMGAGGTARAVVYALSERSVKHIHVVNRTLDRAIALREEFGKCVNPVRWEELGGLLGGAGVLVNATSLGMIGKPPLTVNLARLPASAVVADAVYAPLETALLAAARTRGLRTVDGLGMLLHQAVPGFELWFGVRPEVTPELRALVEADLLRNQA